MNRVIAIDGPAGSGKSTVARQLADRLGLAYLDTGAMYRAATWAVLQARLDPNDDEAVAALVARTSIDVEGGVVNVGSADADSVDVTEAIRGAEVSGLVSVVAAQPAVRADLRDRQRVWVTRRGGAVVEGRDIGSVVFPDAEAKLFLTASPEARARRRASERLDGQRSDVDVEDIARTAAELARRDHIDSTRADSPLVTADGSTTIDTSDMTIDEVVDHLAGLLR